MKRRRKERRREEGGGELKEEKDETRCDGGVTGWGGGVEGLTAYRVQR